jgi:hypothetical protein
MIWIVGADALADAFRGLDGGAVSAWLGVQLGHAAWEGLTFYDLIFPLFLFIVGVAVPLSLDRIVEREGRSAALRRVLVRGLVMYTLGVLYYGGISHGWDQIRWVGVLQRLAAGYVVAALLHLWCRPRTIVAVGVTLLIGYWALLTFVPVPGVGAGDYARGRNLANWVDAHWLPGKVWYGDYDPEGLLSTLPALVSALLGLAAARVVRDDHRSAAGRLRLLVVVGRGRARAGVPLGAAVPDLQAHLDLLVCAGDRWLELPAAGPVSRADRCPRLARVGHAVCLGGKQCAAHLFRQPRGGFSRGVLVFRRWRGGGRPQCDLDRIGGPRACGHQRGALRYVVRRAVSEKGIPPDLGEGRGGEADPAVRPAKDRTPSIDPMLTAVVFAALFLKVNAAGVGDPAYNGGAATGARSWD